MVDFRAFTKPRIVQTNKQNFHISGRTIRFVEKGSGCKSMANLVLTKNED